MQKRDVALAGVALAMVWPAAAAVAAPAPAPAVTSAEGVYQGTVSNGATHFSLVLDTGDVHVLFGQTINFVFGVSGFLRGTGKRTSGTFAATDVREYAPAATGTVYALNGAGAALDFTIGSQHRLIAAGTDASRTNGSAWTGAR